MRFLALIPCLWNERDPDLTLSSIVRATKINQRLIVQQQGGRIMISADELRRFVQEAQEQPPKSTLRRLAIQKALFAIQHSDQITCKTPGLSEDDYNWALCQTWLDVSLNIDKYNGATDVMTWVNMLLERRLMEANQ